MKKTILIISLCFIGGNVFAENIRKITSTHYYEGNPKKEMTFCNDDGDEIAKEYYHIDGRVMGVKGSIPDGEVYEYFLSERLKSKAVYRSNLLIEEAEYYDTGLRKSMTNNEWSGRHLITSKYVMYYPNGTKQQEIQMDSNGNGFSKLYYDTGELFEDALLKDAYRDGAVTQYYKNGKKMLSGFMKDDMLDGAAQEYDLNGDFVRKVIYEEDEVVDNVK